MYQCYEFKRVLNLLKNSSTSDRQLRKATIWRENLYNNLETLSTYDNYEILKEKMDSFENPIKLWEFISQSETLEDFFLWYKDKATSNTIAGFDSNQEAFDNALTKLGLL